MVSQNVGEFSRRSPPRYTHTIIHTDNLTKDQVYSGQEVGFRRSGNDIGVPQGQVGAIGNQIGHWSCKIGVGVRVAPRSQIRRDQHGPGLQ